MIVFTSKEKSTSGGFREDVLGLFCKDISDVVAPLAAEMKIVRARKITRNIGKEYKLGSDSDLALSFNVRLYKRMGLVGVGGCFADRVESLKIDLRREIRQHLREKELAHVGYRKALDERLIYAHLEVYVTFSLLIRILEELFLLDQRRHLFEVYGTRMRAQSRVCPEEWVGCEVKKRSGLCARDCGICFEELGGLGLASNKEKEIGVSGARRRDLFKWYMEWRIDVYFIIYVVESGRDGAAWVMSMAERIKREGCSRRLVKDYGIYGIDSGREGALWLGGLYETMQREGWTRMSIGGGVLQDGVKRLLQKAYEDLAGLMRDLEGLGRACRGEGEKRPAFRVVVEKIEQIELKKGRIKVLELALRRVWLDQEGVQIGVRSGERSCFLFVDANWGVVEEIFSREAELKRIKGEVAKLSFSLVSKYERNLVAWITRPRCGGINKKV